MTAVAVAILAVTVVTDAFFIYTDHLYYTYINKRHLWTELKNG